MGIGPKKPEKMAGSSRWLRSSLRVLTLTTSILGLLIMALEFGTIAEKEKKIQVEKGANSTRTSSFSREMMAYLVFSHIIHQKFTLVACFLAYADSERAVLATAPATAWSGDPDIH